MSTLVGRRIVLSVTAPRSAGFVAGQLAALAAAGARPYLLTSPSEEVADRCAAAGATFVPVAMPREPAPARDAIAFARIASALARIAPDLVDAGTPKAGLLVISAARLVGVGHRVQTLHGLRYETARGAMRAALWAAQRWSCAIATHVVCASPSLRERAIAGGLVAAERAIVLGDGTIGGIDLARFTPDPVTAAAGAALRARLGIAAGAPVVGYVGRLARDKGIGMLAAAWPALAARGARLIVAGDVDPTDPPPAGALEALRRAGAQLIGQADPVPVYAAIDVLALPTRREGMPTVALEAAAMGRPVVATVATGCVDAVVDGVTGALVPFDPTALATALVGYLDDPARRARDGAAGRARVVACFSSERMQALTVELYARILGGAP